MLSLMVTTLQCFAIFFLIFGSLKTTKISNNLGMEFLSF